MSKQGALIILDLQEAFNESVLEPIDMFKFDLTEVSQDVLINLAIINIGIMKDLIDDIKHFKSSQRLSAIAFGAIGQYGDNWRSSLLYKWLEPNVAYFTPIFHFDDGLQEVLKNIGQSYLDYNNAISSYIKIDIVTQERVLCEDSKLRAYLNNHCAVAAYINQNIHTVYAINEEFSEYVKDILAQRKEQQKHHPDQISLLKETLKDRIALVKKLNRRPRPIIDRMKDLMHEIKDLEDNRRKNSMR